MVLVPQDNGHNDNASQIFAIQVLSGTVKAMVGRGATTRTTSVPSRGRKKTNITVQLYNTLTKVPKNCNK